MNGDSHQQLQILAEHYRDTFAQAKEHIHRRDRLFGYSLVALVALSFRSSHAADSDRVLRLLVERGLGPGAQIDERFLAVLLWFVFFAIVSRYFQANVFVDRQYRYLDRLENEICQLYGNEVLAREGKGYLARYPLFSDWMHVVYTWLFPAAVVAATLWSVVAECRRLGAATVAGGIVIALALAIVGTVGVYVYSTKFETNVPGEQSSSPDAGLSG